MPTRGQVSLTAPKDNVFSAALECCKELNAKIKNIDQNAFTVEGHFPMSWVKNRYGADFKIIVSEEQGSTVVSIFDLYFVAPHKKHIEPFFAALAKRIPLNTAVKIDVVQKGAENQSTLPTTTVSQSNDILPQFKNNQLAFEPTLVKRFEYDVSVEKFGNIIELKEAEKMIIYPIEVGNKIQFRKKKDQQSLLEIPIGSVKKIVTVAETTGEFRKKDDLMLSLDFEDRVGALQSIIVNVDDKAINEIINHVNKLQEIEKEYWKSYDMPYTYDSDTSPRITRIYYKTPFLAEDEDILWFFIRNEGVINKHTIAIVALTNFRVFIYSFETHECGRVLLPAVDDVIVTNQHRESQSQNVGVFTGRGRGGFAGVYSGSSSGSSHTIGDVVFMSEGKEIVTFHQVSDPHGVARLAKAAMKQLKLVDKPKAEEKQQNKQESTELICAKCNTVNPSTAKFCNSCGTKLDSKCEKCGHINVAGASFCNECGFALR